MKSVKAYARGYYIRNDYYNGINYAFVLDVRASAARAMRLWWIGFSRGGSARTS